MGEARARLEKAPSLKLTQRWRCNIRQLCATVIQRIT